MQKGEPGMYYAYTHIRPDTMTIFYVGMGIKDRPWSKHGRSKEWRDIVFLNGGIFITDTIAFVNRDDAYEKEISLIKQFGRVDIGTGILVNKTNGGIIGNGRAPIKRSPEVCKRNGDLHRGKIVRVDTRKKLAINSNNYFKNLDNVRNALLNRTINRGWVLEQVSLDGNSVINRFASAAEAERKTKALNTNIISCLNGKAKTAVGYKWRRSYDLSDVKELVYNSIPDEGLKKNRRQARFPELYSN